MSISFPDLERFTGDTDPHILTIYSDVRSEKTIDVTSWGFILTIDTRLEPDDNSTQVVSIFGDTATDGANGKVIFVFPGTTPPGDYFYGIKRTDGSGNTKTYGSGKITFKQGIP